jgi:hypothetical protein
MGLPTDMFPALFAIPRTAGWMAQWLEATADPEQKIARPLQVYTGARDRQYVPMEQRNRTASAQDESSRVRDSGVDRDPGMGSITS